MHLTLSDSSVTLVLCDSIDSIDSMTLLYYDSIDSSDSISLLLYTLLYSNSIPVY